MVRPKDEQWAHFQEVGKGKEKKNMCIHCKSELKSNITNLKKHLTVCKGYLKSLKSEGSGSQDTHSSSQSSGRGSQSEKETTIAVVSGSQSSVQPNSQSSSQESVASSSKSSYIRTFTHIPVRRVKQPKISEYMDSNMTQHRQQSIDKSLITLCVKKNIPFDVLNSQEFRDFCEKLHSQYEPPTSYTASKHLLNAVHADHLQAVGERLAGVKYLALATDSWTTNAGETVVNVVALIRKPVLLASVVVDESLTGQVYANIVEKAMIDFKIEEKVVQIITDGGANAKSGRDLLADKYKQITTSYCVSHQLNRLIQVLLSTKRFDQQIKLLVKILHHIKAKKTFRRYCEKIARNEGVTFKAPILPSNTRWEYYMRVVDDGLSKRKVLQYLARGQKFDMNLSQAEEELIVRMGTDVYWQELKVVSTSF